MTKERDSIQSQLEDIIWEVLGIREEDLTLNTTWEDLGADPIDQEVIGQAIESLFGISMSEEDFEEYRTLGSTIQYIEQYLS